MSLVSGQREHILSLPVSRDGFTSTTSPLIGRAEGSLLPPRCNSTTRGTNLSRWWDYRMDVRPRHCWPPLLTVLGSSRWDSRKRGPRYFCTREFIPTVPSLASGSWVRYYPRPRRENVTVIKHLTLPATFPAEYIGTHVSGTLVPTAPLAAGTWVCQPL